MAPEEARQAAKSGGSRSRASTPPRVASAAAADAEGAPAAEGGTAGAAVEKVPAAPPATSGKSRFGVYARSVQCLLLMGTRVFQQSMRSALAPLIVFMAKDFDIDTTRKGQLLSAVAFGYLFTQVPGGKLADRIGAKVVTTAALLLSSMFCLAIPFCADNLGVVGLWSVMALMGAVQGPIFPASTVYLSKWMPKKIAGAADEKAWGTSMVDIGTSIGSLITIPVASTLAATVGWRHAYHIIAIVTLCFVAAFHLLASEEPSRCSYISAEELDFLQEHVPKQRTQAEKAADSASGILGVPAHLLLEPGVWAVFIGHVAFNYGVYFMTNWNPTYYADVLKLPPEQAQYHLMVPFVASLISTSCGPALVSMAARRGISLLNVRRLCMAAGMLPAGLALLPIARLQRVNPWATTLLLSVASFCYGVSPSGFKANYLEITERYVGAISGYGNAFATLATWAGPQLVALLLFHFGSWDIVFASVTAVSTLAALNFLWNSTVTPVEVTVASREAGRPKAD